MVHLPFSPLSFVGSPTTPTFASPRMLNKLHSFVGRRWVRAGLFFLGGQCDVFPPLAGINATCVFVVPTPVTLLSSFSFFSFAISIANRRSFCPLERITILASISFFLRLRGGARVIWRPLSFSQAFLLRVFSSVRIYRYMLRSEEAFSRVHPRIEQSGENIPFFPSRRIIVGIRILPSIASSVHLNPQRRAIPVFFVGCARPPFFLQAVDPCAGARASAFPPSSLGVGNGG